MRKTMVAAVVIAVLALAIPAFLQADVKMGVAVGDQGLSNFYLSVGDYNKVPQPNVVAIRQQGIPDEELPVVFFLASKANVPYGEIVKLRLKHMGWLKIALKYRLDPGIFYVPVNGEVKGRVYGKTYGYFHGRPQNKWNKIKLSDEEVVNNVNLRFVSEHYGYDPDEVIRLREGGKSFITINNEINIEKTRVAQQHKKKWFWQKKQDNRNENGHFGKWENDRWKNGDGQDNKGDYNKSPNDNKHNNDADNGKGHDEKDNNGKHGHR
jgi:hypothetical protein